MGPHTAIYAAAAAVVRTIRDTSEPLSKHPIHKEKNTPYDKSRTKETADLGKDTEELSSLDCNSHAQNRPKKSGDTCRVQSR